MAKNSDTFKELATKPTPSTQSVENKPKVNIKMPIIQKKIVKKQLIKENVDMFESLKEEKSKTSLLTLKSADKQLSGFVLTRPKSSESIIIDCPAEQVDSVDEMAKELVTNIINSSLNMVKSSLSQIPQPIEENTHFKHHRLLTRDSSLSQYSISKSDSRLGYYKDYQSENNDLKMSFDNEVDLGDDEAISDKIVLEFEDEPYEFAKIK